MRAFLSHSSKDKGFVEAIASLLRPGTYELDFTTFDAGLVNSTAIIKALERSDLFCLFLSNASVRSSYVEFETLLGIEFLARGGIGRFLTICRDEAAFKQASENVKFFNVVRKCPDPETAARLIQGQLVSATSQTLNQTHPFIGREAELLELEQQVNNHTRPPTKAIFVSGNFGSGRRTLAEKFYANQFPQVGHVFPTVKVEPFFGLEELYRRFLTDLRPAMTLSEFKTRINAFQIASVSEKRRLVAQLLNSLLAGREAALLIDQGGILNDAGAFEAEFNEVVSLLEARPHPPAVIIAPRMVPRPLRRQQDDISYVGVRSLNRDASSRLVSRLLRENALAPSAEAMDALISLSDGHPFNIYRMMDEIKDRGLDAFLANPTSFIDWKHRHSSEYLSKVSLRDEDKLILGLLKLVPQLDFAAICGAVPVTEPDTSDALLRLMGLHVIEADAELFSIAPPLRVAIERDRRLSLNAAQTKQALDSLVSTLSIRLEEGTAPIALVDAAVLAGLERGGDLDSLSAAFLMPSHYVWLANRQYDQQHFAEAIRLAKEALKGISRLSSGGTVAACRYLCLAASRIGEDATFDEGMRILQGSARDDWARSNVEYLKGFNLRFKGNLPEAEEHFRRAYQLSPGNLHAAREIAAIALARGNLDEAEQFAREAHSHGQRNPYLIDMLISVLVRRHGRSAKHSSEIHNLFETLEKVGEEGGRSFYTTRRAEFEHLWGNNRLALDLIEKATKKTPRIFDAQRLRVEILLKEGKKTEAAEAISDLREIVNGRDPRERRSNYRTYLETEAHYFQEVGRFDDAKAIFDDAQMFTRAERDAAIREIEIGQSYKKRY